MLPNKRFMAFSLETVFHRHECLPLCRRRHP
jgi:hypothetical protein